MQNIDDVLKDLERTPNEWQLIRSNASYSLVASLKLRRLEVKTVTVAKYKYDVYARYVPRIIVNLPNEEQ